MRYEELVALIKVLDKEKYMNMKVSELVEVLKEMKDEEDLAINEKKEEARLNALDLKQEYERGRR